MSGGPDSGPDGNVFQHSDPFHDDEVEQYQEQPESAAAPPADNEALRLAGVRSHNPFANTGETNANELRESTTRSDVSPGEELGNQNSIDHVADEGNQRPASIPASPAAGEAISPGAGNAPASNTLAVTNTDPFDHAYTTATRERVQSDVPPETELHDRAERGTDVYAIVDPASSENEKASSGPNGGDSDHDSLQKDKKPGIAFANSDNVGKVETHKDDDDDSDSHGIMEKLTTAVKDRFHLQDMQTAGPFKGLNPTNIHMRMRYGSDDAKDTDKEVGIIWRSRDNRKGRNSVVIPRTSMAYPNLPSKNRPVYSSSFKGVGRNLYRMAFTFPYWDMAFWSGWSYTWGSVLFVIDGVWAWGPVGWDVEWKVEQDYLIGIFFFVGALLYQLGAVMAFLEAVNDGSFHGSAMKRFLEGHEDEKKQMLDDKFSNFFGHLNPRHEKKKHEEQEAEAKEAASIDPNSGWKTIHRRERPGSIYPGQSHPGPRRGGVDLGEAEEGESVDYLTWRWWPTWYAFRTHHIYEIGYIACSIQLFGATLYSWCGLVSVPGIEDGWGNPKWYGAYWFPEIFGSSCFLTASFMFIFETQEKWWKPELNVMGWWIGFWAMIGSWGFLTNGIFGVAAQATELEWAEFAAECCTTWGSFGYLCSALCQWYEAVNKHPVTELYDGPGDRKSWRVDDV